MALRTNLVLNPSFETGVLGGWSTNGSNPSGNQLDREQSGSNPQGTVRPVSGSWYAYARRTTAGQLSFFNTTNMPVVAGRLYSASCSINRDGANQVALDIDWYTSGNAYISSSTGTLTPGNGVWARVSSVGVAPSNAASARFFLRFVNQGANQFVRVDAVLFEEGALGYYFDGSLPGHRWVGAVGGSRSIEDSDYRRNYVANPSFENDVAGYTVASVRSGVTASSSVGRGTAEIAGREGGVYGFVGITGDGSSSLSTVDVIVQGAPVKVAGGDEYVFSAAFQVAGVSSYCVIDWLDSNGTQLSTGGRVIGARVPGRDDAFVRGSVTAVAPAGAQYARPALWAITSADTTQRFWRFDGLLHEATPGGSYFDGTYPDSQWVGAPHGSTSSTLALVEHTAAVRTVSSSPAAAAANLDPGHIAVTTTSPSPVRTDGSVGRSGATVTSSTSTTTATAIRRTTGGATTASTSTSSLAADSPGAGATTSTSTATATAHLRMPARTEATTASSSSVVSGDIVPASGASTASTSTTTATASVTAPLATTTSSTSTATAAAFVDKRAAAATGSASQSSAESTHFGLLKTTTTSRSTTTADGFRTARTGAVTASSSFSSAMAEGPTVTVSYGFAWATAGLLTEGQVVTESQSTAQIEGTADIPVAVFTSSSSPAVAELYAVIDLAAVTASESDTFAEARPPSKLGGVRAVSSSTAEVTSQLVVPVAINAVGALGSTASASAFVFTPVFQAPAGPVKEQSPHPVMRLLVADTLTGRIGWELPYTQIGWNAPLNKAGTMTATLTLDEVLEAIHAQGAADPDKALRETLTGPLRFSYVITYGNAAVWAGPMRPAVSFGPDSSDVSVGGSQLESLLEDRVLIGQAAASVPLNAEARDVVIRQSSPAGALYRVALHAIDTADGRASRRLPITCAQPPANLVGDEDFIYRSYDLVSAWKAMTDLMDRDDGPDMRLDPYLVEASDGLYVQWDLQVGEPLLPSSAIVGDDGPLPWTFTDQTSRIELATDAVGMATTYYASGDGQDRAKLVTSVSSDRLTRLGWPAIEKVETGRTSESDQDKLAGYARGLLAAHATPTAEWQVSTPIDGANPLGSYRAGDEAFLDVRTHPLMEPGRYRRRITEVSHDGGPMVTVKCDSDDNEMVGA